MATPKPHWTSTPEGRERMANIQKKAWRKKKHALAQAVDKKFTPRRLAREELHELARVGAQQMLVELEKKITKLRLFLSVK